MRPAGLAAHAVSRRSTRLLACTAAAGMMAVPTAARAAAAEPGWAHWPLPRPSASPVRPPAKPETPEHALVRWVNASRAAAGLHAVAVSGDLTAVAHRHTARMARTGKVFHNTALGTEVHGWASLSEDVGRAGALVDLERALLATPGDRAHLHTAGFRQVGVGVASSRGLLYVTVIMRQPEV